MVKSLKQFSVNNYLNALGWSTKRKIVVIESDDWGSIRTPSKYVYDSMVKKGLIHNDYIFAKYDSLASEHDLLLLFDLLTLFKDKNNTPPVFTANCLMANPDFEKIRQHNFEKYFFEHFTNTLSKYPKHANSYKLWNQGISDKLFLPQFHGREHIQVARWMKKLFEGDIPTRAAFDMETFVVLPDLNRTKDINFAPALDMDDKKELNVLENIIEDGSKMFQSTFGFKSDSFIAPNYTWHPTLEKKMFETGIKYIQSSKIQNIPVLGKDGYKRKLIFTGKKNKAGHTYLARNVYFEPSLNNDTNLVNSCLHSISNAFFWGKPAIISSHRLNYVGYIDEQNRDKNLLLLKELLSKLITKWPDVEFMSSPQLGALINNER